MKRTVCVLLALCLVSCLCSCSSYENTVTDFALDTVVSVTVYKKEDVAFAEDAISLCKELDRRLSKTAEDSDIQRINSLGKAEVSDETLFLLNKAAEYSRLSDGLFDASIGPLSALWDFKNQAVPDIADIQACLPYVDYTAIQITGNTVCLPNGAALDLGGIAKGYIADRMKERLLENGVRRAIINLGGNVMCLSDAEPFTVAVIKPFSEGEYSFTLSVRDEAVVTSGVYERYFEKDGNFYHHILNPKTGRPAESDLLSATVVCEKAVDGDALSTICILLGREKASALIRSLDNVSAYFVDTQYKTYEIK